MTIFDSVILGVVEGLTEFLPISSTAHLMLTSKILDLGSSTFVKTFEIAIQSGAMLAVVMMYWKSFFDKELLKRILVAFIPTAILGFVLYSFAKSYLLNNIFIVAVALIVGGIVLIIFELHEEKKKKLNILVSEKDIKDISLKRIALIGAIQALAIVPGVSRSGATIIGGRLLGLSRIAVVEFSFLLAVPTILSATIYDIYKTREAFLSSEWILLVIGFIFACITAFVCIRWFLSYIRKNSFKIFGVYRIVIAVLVILFLL